MPYNPSLHSTVGKSTGLYGSRTADARSYYYDEGTYTYRPYTSTAEVLSYLTPTSLRQGHFLIFVTVGTTVVTYWFRDGIADTDLILFDEVLESGSFAANLDLSLLTNLGNTINVTGLGDLLGSVIKEATYDEDSTTLTFTHWDGTTTSINLKLKQRRQKISWYPTGDKDGINQIFSVGEAYEPSKTEVLINGILQQYGDNYIELDNGVNGQVQIFTPPASDDYPVIKYYPINFS